MITLTTPINIPAKTFAEGLITELIITASSTTQGRASIAIRPLDAATNSLAPNDMTQRVSVDDLFAVMAAVPELAAAYQAVLTAVPATLAYLQTQQNQPTP